MDDRFTDDFRRVYGFVDRVLVVCPKCAKCASISDSTSRLICPHCGRIKDNIRWDIIGPESGTLGLSLFLQTDCGGENLWAFNLDHLRFLRDYVAAKHRAHARDDNGWSNRSLANRLPKWMTSSKNRDAVLRAIDRLADSIGT